MRPAPTGVGTVVTAILVIVISVGPGDAACLRGSSSSEPAPAVTFLRSYRASLRSPVALATDSSGRVYVADALRGEVLTRSADGRIIARMAGLGSPIAIAVDRHGRIYLGHAATGAVSVFDQDWEPLFSLGQGSGEFVMPNDIAVDDTTGRVYVSDSSSDVVRVYDRHGGLVFQFGGSGNDDGEFNFPAGLFVDVTNAELLVSDQLNSRIQVFDLDGTFRYCLGRRGTGPGKFYLPQGLWVDSQGLIFVADAFDGRIQILERNGDSRGFISAFGSNQAEVRVPTDIVIDNHSRLFVAAANNERLEVFGINDYADPETTVPAVVRLEPATLTRGCLNKSVTAHIEVPGYPLAAISATTILANGVSPVDSSIVIGDYDDDSIPDLGVIFDRSQLLATLPLEPLGEITLSGIVGDKTFVALGHVALLVSGDDDTDSVCDEGDLCPGTRDGELVDESGCSIAQQCPCQGPVPGAPWVRHRHYFACVGRAAQRAVDAGLLTPAARSEFTAIARQSDCGRLCPKDRLDTSAAVWSCIDRLCPCMGRAPGHAWKSRRRYLSCVRRRARQARRAGLLTPINTVATVLEAKQSSCAVP